MKPDPKPCRMKLLVLPHEIASYKGGYKWLV
nr:MAG TPA: hypothetical protein [Caudoviricetes sp.]